MTTIFSDTTQDTPVEWRDEDANLVMVTNSPRPDLPPDADTDDPDAPYGRRPDGKPYRIPKSERLKRGAELAASRAAKREAAGIMPKPKAQPPRGATTAARAAKDAAPGLSRVDAALGLVAIPAFALGAAASIFPSLRYDSLALTLHAQPIAEAAAAAADDLDWLANLLDRAGDLSPKLALASAFIPLILQIAANHKIGIPAGEMGTLSHEKMDAMLGGGGDGATDDAE